LIGIGLTTNVLRFGSRIFNVIPWLNLAGEQSDPVYKHNPSIERCLHSLSTLASASAGDTAFGDSLVTGFESAR
jgi:hypothetical protein